MTDIYILHSWQYSIDNWDNICDMFDDKKFKIHRLRVPGLTAPIDKPWTIVDYASWLKKILAKKKNVVLIGSSNGGRIAAYYAATNSKNVSKLILIDSAGIYDRSLVLQSKRVIFKSLAKLGKGFFKHRFFAKVFYKIIGERNYLNASPTMKKTMVNLINHDLTEIIKSITCPTLIIWGSKDKITKLKDAYVFNKNISKSKLVIIKGEGHSPFATAPDKVYKEIIKFL